MKILIVTPDRNKRHKRDYTHAFKPESEAFERDAINDADDDAECRAFEERCHAPVVIRINQVSKPDDRRRALLTAISFHQPECIAYFGHGFRNSIMQLGINISNIHILAEEICKHASSPKVIFYACSVADGSAPGGDGGICDTLRDECVKLGAKGVTVYGHSTAGHTTFNPFVRVFDSSTSKGGEWLVEPGTHEWPAWKKALKEHPTLRFDYPFMTRAEIDEVLGV